MDYYHISAQELGKGAKLPILKLGDSGEVFYEMAAEMCAAIRANNAAGKPTVFICPVGPVGQYPIFVRLVNREQLSLRNCWFINMDEYLTDDGQWIAEENPLSFRGFMAREVYGKIAPELLMPEEQRVFPDPNDLGRIPALIEELGGVDIAFGGIGITGHLGAGHPPGDEGHQLRGRPGRRAGGYAQKVRHHRHEGDSGGAEAAPGRVPGLAPGRVPPGGLRRGDRRVPRHPGPEPPRRPALRQRQRRPDGLLRRPPWTTPFI